ncbi:hypothetical protein ACYSNV_07690 [Myroides sp. LJL119]
MKKLKYFIISAFFVFSVYGQETLNSTKEYSFTSSDGSKPTYITEAAAINNNGPTGRQRYTPDGILLTSTRNTYGGFMINDLLVDLRKGARFEFDYSIFQGENGFPLGAGLTFFMYDSQVNFQLGYHDSALGYSYNEQTGVGFHDGLQGGYLGIALDVAGRFYLGADKLSKVYEHREGITATNFTQAGYPGLEQFKWPFAGSHLTLRGALNSKKGNYYRGTAVLVTKSYPGMKTANDQISMGTLDYNTGQYNFQANPNSVDFDIGSAWTSTQPVFNRITVDMSPIKDSDGNQAMLIFIEATDDKGKTTVLLDNFIYQQSYQTYDQNGNIYTGSAIIPKAVRIGFSASATLTSQGKVMIGNLKVTSGNGFDLPPVAQQVCVSDSGNSLGATAEITPFDKDKDNINVSTFNFLDASNNPVGMVYEQNYVGTWRYDPTQNLVTLVVSNPSVSPQTTLQVNYIVDNTSGETSSASSIELQALACGAFINTNVRSPGGE